MSVKAAQMSSRSVDLPPDTPLVPTNRIAIVAAEHMWALNFKLKRTCHDSALSFVGMSRSDLALCLRSSGSVDVVDIDRDNHCPTPTRTES